MFCQNCGNTIIEGLSYCNRCGFRTSGAIEKIENRMMPTSKPTSIIITLSIVMGLIVLTALGLLFPLLIVLLKSDVRSSAVVMILLMFFGTVFGISWLLIQQISRALDSYLQRGGSDSQALNASQPQQPEQLFSRNTGQIEAPREPFISVTENTTRILDSTFQGKKL